MILRLDVWCRWGPSGIIYSIGGLDLRGVNDRVDRLNGAAHKRRWYGGSFTNGDNGRVDYRTRQGDCTQLLDTLHGLQAALRDVYKMPVQLECVGPAKSNNTPVDNWTLDFDGQSRHYNCPFSWLGPPPPQQQDIA